MLTTANRGYSYPEYTDPADFPTQIQDLATDVDLDLRNNLDLPTVAAVDAPSARVFRDVGTQAVAANTNVTLSYGPLATYDNDGMYNSGVSTTNLVINTPGVYLMTGSVNISADGAAGGAATLILMSSGGVVTNPVGTSRNLDNNQPTSLSCTTLHQVLVAPETITMITRHNHGAALNASIAQLTVTRIG